jgi:SpoVK/Ycf46/Vps4 family AAA+-type ATPase
MDEQMLAAAGARRINTDTEPGELVLPAEAERRLGWIAEWLTQPPQLWSEWGLQHYLDGGLRALFRGPSGTGKTMAAVALAQGTGRALIQVDGAAQALGELFGAAEKAKAILLFDGADDDLPGLLRRIEPFAGLAIIETGDGGKLGAGTVGRLDVIVDFPLPDAAARRQLWEKLLATAKLDKSAVDTAKLGADHALSGAEILRAVRMAALLATSAGKRLDMELLEAAAGERSEMRSGG